MLETGVVQGAGLREQVGAVHQPVVQPDQPAEVALHAHHTTIDFRQGQGGKSNVTIVVK